MWGHGGRDPTPLLAICACSLVIKASSFPLRPWLCVIESSTRNWNDPVVIVAFGIGTLALFTFALVESRAKNPVVPLSLFRERNFAGANLLTLLLYSALSGMFFFFPLNPIQVQGYTRQLPERRRCRLLS